MKPQQEDPKEMVGGCCVCSDENGWTENPLVYCDGQGCNVAVHQACYGIVTVPTGSWFCRKCESQERAARVRCELCPSKDGALKRTDSGGWAHVVCALYIPEVRFGNVTTMEPIMLQLIPADRFNKPCYICEESGRENRATVGACMQCNKAGCKTHFHVTCAQSLGLLCEEAGNYLDNVKYCGYCQYHFSKLKKGSHVKTIPPYRPSSSDVVSSDDDKTNQDSKEFNKLKKRIGKPDFEAVKSLSEKITEPEIKSSTSKNTSNLLDNSFMASSSSNSSGTSGSTINAPVIENKQKSENSSSIIVASTAHSNNINHPLTVSSSNSVSTCLPSSCLSSSSTTTLSTTAVLTSTTMSSSSSLQTNPVATVAPSTSNATLSTITTSTKSPSQVSTSVLPSNVNSSYPLSTSSSSVMPNPENEKQRKLRRNGPRTPSGNSSFGDTESIISNEDTQSGDLVLNICEEKNLSVSDKENDKVCSKNYEDSGLKLNVQYTPNVSAQSKLSPVPTSEPSQSDVQKRSRSSSEDRSRRVKRGPGANKPRGKSNTRADISSGRDSGPSSPESFNSDHGIPPAKKGRNKSETKDSPNSVITNGISPSALLLGNQINPASAVAQKMTDTLHAELEAHSIYKEEEKANISLVGPALPIKKENGSSSPANGATTAPPPFPQSLEQLLERQWEQGSQFLMEQAQHFDIASLLSCLYQLRQENVRLEETVTSLASRRDHLLAVNARLSVPLSAQQGSAPPTTPSTTPQPTPTSTSTLSLSAPLVNNHHPSSDRVQAQIPSSQVHASNPAAHPSRSQSHSRHPSGGSSHSTPLSSRDSVHRGGTSPHERRSAGAPLENGLGECDYRYRSPTASVDPHRQQSPAMLPPAQPSPTLRHSPASGGSYHTSSSPHASHTVASHSPSGASIALVHQAQQPLLSSAHPRDLARITSHASSSVANYPVYQMVSPPVASHHSPVSIATHQSSHAQSLMRRELEVSRGSSSSVDKR